jgi:hypothetical protein
MIEPVVELVVKGDIGAIVVEGDIGAIVVKGDIGAIVVEGDINLVFRVSGVSIELPKNQIVNDCTNTFT